MSIPFFFFFFFCILVIYIKFSAFWKKRSASLLKYFCSYGLQNMLFLECPKAPVSEHPSGINVFTGRKNCCNLHGCTFILVFNSSSTNWVRKDLSLVRSEILGLFGNTLTGMYSRHNWDKFLQQVEMPLSSNFKKCPQFFFEFLKFT